jgi:hypothetical protein
MQMNVRILVPGEADVAQLSPAAAPRRAPRCSSSSNIRVGHRTNHLMVLNQVDAIGL